MKLLSRAFALIAAVIGARAGQVLFRSLRAKTNGVEPTERAGVAWRPDPVSLTTGSAHSPLPTPSRFEQITLEWDRAPATDLAPAPPIADEAASPPADAAAPPADEAPADEVPAAEAAAGGARVAAGTEAGARRGARLGAAGVLLSVVVLIALEAALLAPGHTLAADIVAAVLVFILLNAATIVLRSESPNAWATACALQALALVALARVVGFGLPLGDGSAAVATLVVAALIGLAAAWAAPTLGVSRRTLIRFRPSVDQAVGAAAGLGLGLAAYAVGAHKLWAPGAGASRIIVALVAVAAASVTEELLFRGVVQTTLQRSLGRTGLLAASALFAATYLDFGPAQLVMVVALAGLVFAVIVAYTGNLTGALAGHALFALGAGGFWPVLLGRRHHAWLYGTDVIVALGVALAAMTLIALWTALTTAAQAPR